MDDTSTGNLTTEQGAGAIKSLLYPQDQAPQPQSIQEDAAPTSEQVEPEAEADIEYEGDDGDTLPELFEVKVNGETMEVTLEELKKGYQLERDYTQKSQKLAEERKAIEAERGALSGINSKFEQLNEVVNYVQQVNAYVESNLPPEPDRSLLQSNPAAYIEQKEARQAALMSLAAIHQRMEQTKAQAKEAMAELQKHGAAVIQQKMPELMTSEGSAKLYGYLQESYGYSPEVINANVDANLFILAEKARRWDEMQNKVVSPAKQPQRVVKQAQKPRQVQSSQQLQKAQQSFREKPNVNNAAQLIKGFIT